MAGPGNRPSFYRGNISPSAVTRLRPSKLRAPPIWSSLSSPHFRSHGDQAPPPMEACHGSPVQEVLMNCSGWRPLQEVKRGTEHVKKYSGSGCHSLCGAPGIPGVCSGRGWGGGGVILLTPTQPSQTQLQWDLGHLVSLLLVRGAGLGMGVGPGEGPSEVMGGATR